MVRSKNYGAFGFGRGRIIGTIMRIPNYTIEEHYEDHPHWNSGYWRSNITFSDGIKVSFPRKSNEITPNDVYRKYVYHKVWEFLDNRRIRDKMDVEIVNSIMRGEKEYILNLEEIGI
jgi:hypothetical protein